MTEPERHIGDRGGRRMPRNQLPFVLGCLVSVALVAAVGAYCATESGSASAQSIGDFAIFLAAAAAAVSCGWAAHKASEERAAWRLLSVSATVYGSAMALFFLYGVTRDHVYPFPSLADAGFVGYAVPAAAALFCFP